MLLIFIVKSFLIIIYNLQFKVILLFDKYLIVIALNMQSVMNHIKTSILLLKVIIINEKDQLI